jgi:Fe-S-cluster containining protein
MAEQFSPCARCREACCREYLVTVTGLDVYRISRGLGLAPTQFAVAVDYDNPATGFRLDGSARRYRLALDKQRSPRHQGWCVFWMPLGDGLGRCGIYSLRPQVCRAYPATLIDGEVARRTDVLCPDGSWGPGSALLSEQWRQRTERQYAELEIDAIVNRRWNQSTLPAQPADAYDCYLTWMLRVYERFDTQDSSPLRLISPGRAVLEDLARVLDEVPAGVAG